MQEMKSFEVRVASNDRTLMRNSTNRKICSKFEKWDSHIQGIRLSYTAPISVMNEN